MSLVTYRTLDSTDDSSQSLLYIQKERHWISKREVFCTGRRCEEACNSSIEKFGRDFSPD